MQTMEKINLKKWKKSTSEFSTTYTTCQKSSTITH